MNTVPEISIITPVWNGLPYIRECIESVLSQEFQNWELLIGDNCSTDGTREYLSQLDDPRIRLFKHEKNLGIYGNLNFLLSEASTPLAYFLCADDYFFLGGLGNVITEWKIAGPNVAYICFNSKDSLSYSKLMRYSHSVMPQRLDPAKSRLAFFLFGNFPGNLSNMSVRVSSIREAGFFAGHLKSAGDFELWARLGRKSDIVVSNTKSAFVRRHEGVASNYLNKNGEQYPQQIAIFETLVDELSSEYDRKRLISYFNIGICSFHFRRAIKSAFYGNFAYMKVVLNAKSPILWPKWKQLLTCFPLGFTEGIRESISVYLAKSFVNQKNRVLKKDLVLNNEPVKL